MWIRPGAGQGVGLAGALNASHSVEGTESRCLLTCRCPIDTNCNKPLRNEHFAQILDRRGEHTLRRQLSVATGRDVSQDSDHAICREQVMKRLISRIRDGGVCIGMLRGPSLSRKFWGPDVAVGLGHGGQFSIARADLSGSEPWHGRRGQRLCRGRRGDTSKRASFGKASGSSTWTTSKIPTRGSLAFNSIAIDQAGDIYVGGHSNYTQQFHRQPLDRPGRPPAAAASRSLILRYEWAFRRRVSGLAIDGAGNVFAVGQTNTTTTPARAKMR